ncbi:MAG: GH116 family glycosyl-hydrolase [Armatimonadota bacterium]
MRRWLSGLLLLGLAMALPARAAMTAAQATQPPPRFTSGVPLGGIGTGKVELLPDGTFGNLTLNNNWGRPLAELPASFFALRTRSGGQTDARVLASRSEYDFPTVSGVHYFGAFPKAQVGYTDPKLPVDVTLLAHSALVPQDLKNSSLPAAVFTFTLTNSSPRPVDASLAFSWENVLGRGGDAGQKWDDRTGNTQAIHAADGRVGLLFSSTQKPSGARRSSQGQYALTGEAEGGKVAILPYWNAAEAGEEFWDAFTGETLFDEKPAVRAGQEGSVHPAAALAVSVQIPAQEARQVHFVLGWHLPNWYTAGDKNEGHFYANEFKDAWSVASYAAQYRETLLSGTEQWHDLLMKSSLPEWLKLKLVNDAFPLVSNSIFTRDGSFTLVDSPTSPQGGLGALDQWLVSRTLLGSLFPELDRKELLPYTIWLADSGQGETGRPGRLMGSLTEGFTPPRDADWPDVGCNYVLSVYRQFRWSGDLETMKSRYPAVTRVLGWLKERDKDGDYLPEGGSTWTYREYPGTFVYTAGLYLATLRAAEVMAGLNADKKQQEECAERFKHARLNAMAQLWNGRFFTKYLDPVKAERSTNLFGGTLAGVWATELLGLAPVFDPAVTDTSLRGLIDLIPGATTYAAPNEVRPDGTADPGLTDVSWPGHLQSYLAAPAIARGRADAGLDLLRRLAEVQSPREDTGWDAALAYSTRTGAPVAGPGHSSTMGSWNTYLALTGLVLDEPGSRLTVAPSLPTSWNGFHAPLFSPRYWAWADYARNPLNAATNLRLKLVKKLDDRPVLLNALTTTAPAGTALDDLMLLVTGPAGALEGKAELVGEKLTYTFKVPYEWRPGETLEVSMVPPEANQLVLAFNPEQVLSYGSQVTAKDLQRDKQIKFTLVNPTKERQVVNVRFRGTSDRNFEVYQNGTQLPRFTPDTEDERLTLVVPASPVSEERVQRLRRVDERLQAARGEASRAGKLAEVQPQIDAIQNRVRAALAADQSSRESQVLLHPVSGRIPGIRLFRKKLKDPPPMVPQTDPEPAVNAAETALQEAPAALAKEIQDPQARAIVLSALMPARAELSAEGEPAPGGSLPVRLFVVNEGVRPLQAKLKLDLPAGWTGAEPAIVLPAGEEGSITFSVGLPAALESRRYRIPGTVTYTSGGAAWTAPVVLNAGHAYLGSWSVIGVWPGGDRGLDQALPPDTELDPAKEYGGRRWETVESPGGPVDLLQQFPRAAPNGVAYAVTQVFSPREQELVLELGAAGEVEAKVNGERVYRSLAPEAGEPGKVRVPIRLRQGWNTVLLKLGRAGDSWRFWAELADAQGSTPTGTRVRGALGE